jgi:hypothetical protein
VSNSGGSCDGSTPAEMKSLRMAKLFFRLCSFGPENARQINLYLYLVLSFLALGQELYGGSSIAMVGWNVIPSLLIVSLLGLRIGFVRYLLAMSLLIHLIFLSSATLFYVSKSGYAGAVFYFSSAITGALASIALNQLSCFAPLLIILFGFD